MNKTTIHLPAILNPISRRKDKSCKLSLDTRELNHEEILTLMSLEGSEMWICLAPNQEDLQVPDEPAEVDEKSPSERLRSVLFVWYKQEVDAGKFVGLFETFKREKMEKIIEGVKSKLLEKYGLVVTQPLEVVDGKNVLSTYVIDVDTKEGQLEESRILLPDIQDPQKMGSAITYYRRYALQSLFLLRAEDDDAQSAKPKAKSDGKTHLETSDNPFE